MLSTQLMRMRNFKALTAAPSRLLGSPMRMPRRARVRLLATKPRMQGVMIQRMRKATMLVTILALLPSTARYSPNVW